MFSIYEIETTNLICHRDNTRLNTMFRFSVWYDLDDRPTWRHSKTSSLRLLKPLLNWWKGNRNDRLLFYLKSISQLNKRGTIKGNNLIETTEVHLYWTSVWWTFNADQSSLKDYNNKEVLGYSSYHFNMLTQWA